METLGEKIYNLRKKYGFSQEELGFRVNVTRQTISQWEANTLQPKPDKLVKLCKIFEVSSDYFLFDEKDRAEIATSNDTSSKKLPLKIKVMISVICVFVLIAIALIVLACLSVPTQDGVETVTSVSLNLTVGAMLGIAIAIIFIIVICLLIAVIIMIKKHKD